MVAGMTNTATETWHGEHAIEIAAAPEAIWNLFRDVASWPRWNAGVERVELHGPFAVGTRFTMKVPGHDAFESTLRDVRPDERFVDETRLGDLVVTVAHEIRRGASGGVRVVYAIDVDGPGAADVGQGISSDFPDVLAALKALVEAR